MAHIRQIYDTNMANPATKILLKMCNNFVAGLHGIINGTCGIMLLSGSGHSCTVGVLSEASTGEPLHIIRLTVPRELKRSASSCRPVLFLDTYESST